MPLRSSTILFSAISVFLGLPLVMAGQEHSITEKSSVGGDPRTVQQSVQSTPPVQQSSPVVKQAVHHDVSPPLFLIPPPPRQPGLRIHDIEPIPRHYQPAAADPVLQPNYPTPLAPMTTLNFDGVGNGFTGPAGTFTVQSAPPDTNGDVGPNQYVQIVNTDFAIFNKSGTPIFGPVPINTLWSGFGGLCQSDNDGDPTVIYDPIADRWVISQLAVTGANGTTVPFLQCVAVSQTADPTGSYNRYSFGYNAFNDYPKIGVWPDAYYTTFNFFNPSRTAFLGGEVCAYDRASMLAGQAATQQCFNVGTSFGGLLPSDLDGAQLPPAGSPNYVLALGVSNNDLAFWKFHVDWTTPANTTLTGPTTLTVATYTAACNGGTCVPQAGTSQLLDSLADRLMYRLAYRNFGSFESLVANHSVTAGSGVGVRWYEIRSPGTTPTIFQQGTYAPDSNFRWMGSIAMDQNGDMALGFSVSGSSLHPGIHYTGRLVGDPFGQMTQGEGTIIDGAGSQTTNLNRWGDYSMMAIDPSDDCTFWYTNEYIPSNGTFNWKTRIGSFKFPNCGVSTPDFSLSTTPSSATVTAGSPASYTENITATGGFTGSVSLSISGLPTGASGTFSPNPATGSSSTLTVTTSSTTPAGSYVFTVTGTSTSPALTHTSTGTLVVQSPDFSLSTTPSSATVTAGSPASYTENITATGGFTGSVSLSISGLPAGASGTFNPNPATGASSALTITTSSSTPAGSYVFTVTGTSTSPALTHTSTATLVVQSALPPPPISFVRAANNLIPTSAASVSVANMVNNASDMLVVACRESAQITITSVTDTAGNGYTKIATALSTGRESALFFAANVKASSANTITCNFASTTGREAIVVEEFSGVMALDGSVTANSNSATTSLPSGNLTTTNANDLLVYEVNVGADSTFTAGPGYTIPPGGSNARLAMQFTTVSSQGTYSTSESWSTAAAADGIFAALAGSATPPAPSISFITPNNGRAGASVTIAGSNFGASQGTSTVTFNGVSAGTAASWSASSITVNVPSGTMTGNVVVTVGGQASNGVAFTVYPSISSVNPSSGPVGTVVTISGNGFGPTQGPGLAEFDFTTATATSWSNTKIVVPVPYVSTALGNPATVDVLVGGVRSNYASFVLVPNITGLNPTSGPIGTSVTITGTSFGTSQGTSTVTFNGVLAGVASNWSDTSITVPVPSGATTGNVALTVNGVASNGINFTVTPPPDFSLSTTPSSATVTAGSPASYTENITATGGFTGSVSLAISGLPAGVSGTFNPNPATGSSSALTITTSSSTPPGSYVFTVTGTSTSPALTHTSTATLVVQSPDFSLSTTPSSATVTAGSPASYTENITATGGFTGSVSLSISGLPTGASGTFNPNPATGASSTLTITTSSSTPPGSYVFTITGTTTSPALTHTSTATLVVQSPPDFSLSTTPSSATVTAGSPASYTENITATGGFTGSVSLAISGLPAGVSGTFNPNPATGSSSALTITTSSSTPPGSYVFTVTGTSTSPALTHTSTATLVVQGPPDFSLSTTPSSATVTAGSPASYTENITATGGFTGSVTLSISGLPAGASGTFNPNPATGASSALTVTTSSSTPAGSYVFTVTGTSTSPALTHTSTATLVVQSALPPPPISFVRAANNLIPTSAASVSVANMVNNASDMLVVACRESAQITITSVTDTAGNSYTKIANALSTGRESALFFAANVKASSGNTISCNFASTTGREAMVVEEFSGVVALDGSVTASNNGTVTSLPSGNLTTTNANDLLVYEVNVGADSTFTPGPGYTLPPGGSNARLAMQFTTVSSQGTYLTLETWSPAAPADAIFAALK